MFSSLHFLFQTHMQRRALSHVIIFSSYSFFNPLHPDTQNLGREFFFNRDLHVSLAFSCPSQTDTPYPLLRFVIDPGVAVMSMFILVQVSTHFPLHFLYMQVAHSLAPSICHRSVSLLSLFILAQLICLLLLSVHRSTSFPSATSGGTKHIALLLLL